MPMHGALAPPRQRPVIENGLAPRNTSATKSSAIGEMGAGQKNQTGGGASSVPARPFQQRANYVEDPHEAYQASVNDAQIGLFDNLDAFMNMESYNTETANGILTDLATQRECDSDGKTKLAHLIADELVQWIQATVAENPANFFSSIDENHWRALAERVVHDNSSSVLNTTTDSTVVKAYSEVATLPVK
ncbi:hypothetical protein NA57DRAFT_77849 [Rhizodiscina lignyota]|uniref:Uncharacterized protein n=1 Tax=Rhizodiscina lignyota TaxID=1504668 RepID=A0A9P4IDE0_9PEZI|nr:hypothetical protein NA57DRAFT_77849 [Rhizodiscina lignyota]